MAHRTAFRLLVILTALLAAAFNGGGSGMRSRTDPP